MDDQVLSPNCTIKIREIHADIKQSSYWPCQIIEEDLRAFAAP